MFGKNFKFMKLIFLENAMQMKYLPTQNSPPSSCNHTLGSMKLYTPPGSILSKICFPQQQKGVEEAMICFIKIQSENLKVT